MKDSNDKSIEIFFSYAHRDEILKSELEKHLRILQRQGLIIAWHESNINPGMDWEQITNTHLNTAQIILLLISADFMDSEYCYSVQMKRALERHEANEARVIPIILRAVHWEDAPFSKLKPLPSNRKPVTRWRSRDEAFADITKGIRDTVKFFSKKPSKPLSITIKELLCPNCKAPVSLPMICWKCGLPPAQICEKCQEKNPIDQEKCQKCAFPLALACYNCKAKNSYEADFCGNCGLQLQLACRECGIKNLPSQEACINCSVPLIQTCNNCNKKNALDAELCFYCGFPLKQICITCEAINHMKDDICWRCNELLDVAYELEIPLHLANLFAK